MSTPIVCSDLVFSWPDGQRVFDGLNVVVGSGRTGLIGANGSGKSTLLRLVAGELAPGRGSVTVAGTLGYLPQNITLRERLRVEEILGIAQTRVALAAIEAGDTDAGHFTTVGDDWDVEERARAMLDRFGLSGLTLDHRVGELSGGEAVLLALAALLLRQPDVLLLDEPTNNLDLDARRALYEAVTSWRGVLMLVSHDRELLEQADTIVELRHSGARSYGGNLTAYEATVAAEQEAAQRTVRAAESDLRRQRRELAEARIKLDRRVRYGRKMWENKREPKVVMGERKRQAQVAAGKHRNLHLDRVRQAEDRLAMVETAVRDDDEVRIDLPATVVPPRKMVAVLQDVRPRFGPPVTLHVRGPERIALVGANGAGKTTLLRTIIGQLPPLTGVVRLEAPARLLPQRLDVLDTTLTIVENVARFAPRASHNTIRAQLARVLFPGERADQLVATSQAESCSVPRSPRYCWPSRRRTY